MTKQERAVKIIPKSKIKNVERFKMEVEILRSVVWNTFQSPCVGPPEHREAVRVVRGHEQHVPGHGVTIQSDLGRLCTGGELFDRITSAGHFTEKQGAVIFKQILNALHYCHKKKIVHRDLKPENFMFESMKPDAPIKLIDFGLSKIFEDPSTPRLLENNRA